MKYFVMSLSANLVALSCVAVAGCLALNEKDGWGWFLIIALFSFSTFSRVREAPPQK